MPPSSAAGRARAGHLIDRDQEAETPLVTAVRDEGEVGAARKMGLERRDRDDAHGVLAHQCHSGP